MLRRLVTSRGEAVILQQAVPEDAAELIVAVDSVAREGAYFLRSRFEVPEEAEQASIAAAHDRDDLMLLAKASHRVVGLVALFRGRAQFQRHLGELGVGVVSDWRRQGVGAALVCGALEWAVKHGIEKVKLGVRVENGPACALYQRFGFVEERRRLRDVKDSEGCYHDVMEMSWFACSSGSQEAGGNA